MGCCLGLLNIFPGNAVDSHFRVLKPLAESSGSTTQIQHGVWRHLHQIEKAVICGSFISFGQCSDGSGQVEGQG